MRTTFLHVAVATFVICFAPAILICQNPVDYTVMLSAAITETPAPALTLRWNKDPKQQLVRIWRKLKEANAFEITVLDSVIGGGTQWTDRNVERGVAYEYRVLRYERTQTGFDTAAGKPIYTYFYGTGYIVSGIAAPPAPRERVLILVDTSMMAPLKSSLATLQTDLENEGWEVTIRSTPRAETFDSVKVQKVRDLIKSEWLAGPHDLGGIVIVGRVPVPYSGSINPDGHPDHKGAWPADGIYGDPDGTYTDNFTNTKNASRPANENIPRDGKFDPNQWNTDIDIPVGRIDFFDMPAFSKSETELLLAYLSKNHAYRTDTWNVAAGGIIDDNFGTYGEVFAASAWRSFSVFGSDTTVRSGDFFTDLAGPSTMLWGYGCGGGTDVGAGGVGTSSDLATKPVNAVFSLLFGSYFGDWNTKNNFLRSAIASAPKILTCGWSGRPHWYMHHMALGETIGYSTRISQNNRPMVNGNLGNYIPNILEQTNQLAILSSGDRSVHIALMGDPTLRAVTKPVAVVGTVTGQTEYPNKVRLTWTKPTGDVQAYLIYRRKAGVRRWKQVTDSPIAATSFQDSLKNDGPIEYMVRCCAIRRTASGTFYDMGKGRVVNVVTTDVAEDRSAYASRIMPVVDVGPNPASTDVNVTLTLSSQANITLELAEVTGNIVWKFDATSLAPGQHHVSINVTALAMGRYMLRTSSDGSSSTSLITISR